MSMIRINECGLRCKCQCYISMSGVRDVSVNVTYNEWSYRCKCQCCVSMSGVGDVGVNVAYQ